MKSYVALWLLFSSSLGLGQDTEPSQSITQRGRTYVTSVRNDYSSTNVTTGAWVQLVASTPGNIKQLHVFDSCGKTLELGAGGSGSEARIALIPPGGFETTLDLFIASGTRLAIRAVSSTCSAGELDITALN